MFFFLLELSARDPKISESEIGLLQPLKQHPHLQTYHVPVQEGPQSADQWELEMEKLMGA